MKRWSTLAVIFLFPILMLAQSTNVSVEKELEKLSKKVEGLNEKLDITTGQTTIQTFISAIGKNHDLNVSIDPSLNIPITVNFTKEEVKNVLVYLIEEYNLNLKITGTIMSFSLKKEIIPPETIDITYNTGSKTLSYDLKDKNIDVVVKKITELSNENIVLDPAIAQKKVNGFIKNISVQSALEKLAISNGIALSYLEDSTFYLTKIENKTKQESVNSKQESTTNLSDFKLKDVGLQVTKDYNGQDLVSLSAINKPITDVIKAVLAESGNDFIFFKEPEGSTTLSVSEVPLEDFLNVLLNNTGYAFKNNEDVFLFGSRDDEKLRNTELVKLQYRALQDVMPAIPADIREGVEMQEFPELNGIVMSGSQPNIYEVKTFLTQIDKPVPVVMIELIIVDVRKTTDVNTGVEAGFADEPVKTSGTILPGLDVTLSSSTINEFLNTIGLTSLGRVTPNFYMSLNALEANGNINIRSTPKLATLNSHEATLNIGETSYYLEQQQNVIGTQNPQTVITNQYKSVNADFSITIKPIVSGDEHVTLDVDVNQSQFTTRIAPDAPPGQSSRQFQSTIRVKNEEMIVLGGLERDENSQSGSGLPILSRVPVLKWFFGNRQKRKDKSKLLVFIKPVIIY